MGLISRVSSRTYRHNMSQLSSRLLFLTLSVLSTVYSETVLVLTDGSNIQVTHSTFFSNIKRAGFELEFKAADDTSLVLVEYGVSVYSHVVIFAPNADEFGGDLSPAKIAEYVDNGGNVLLGLDSRITDTLRATASEFGVETDTEGTYVIDHFNFSPESDEGDHTTLSLNLKNHWTSGKPFLPKKQVNVDSVVYQGIGMVTNQKNELIQQVLNAPSTAYSWSPSKAVSSMPMMVGKETTLIAALEARNNARVLICGSLKFFSDEFSANDEQFARQLGLWAFQRAGVLKLSNVAHFLTESKETLETYTIFDQVTFRVDVHEKNEDTGDWQAAENNDIQVEWTRMDTFVRDYLVKSGGAEQKLDFKLPHTYGVFKFIIQYKRVGYTYIQFEEIVPVRPLQHTQYERFITAAYPYYAASGSMLVGLFAFSCVFLYHK